MNSETQKNVAELMESNIGLPLAKPRKPIVRDDTGYGEGGENFEHDDTGSLMNFSGCADIVYNAIAEHEDWEEGYDY